MMNVGTIDINIERSWGLGFVILPFFEFWVPKTNKKQKTADPNPLIFSQSFFLMF